MSDNKPLTAEELLIAINFTKDVLMQQLVKKGLITEGELPDAVRELKESEKARKEKSRD